MSIIALLLRILLSISLIFDGAGTALAATRMAIEHAATPTSKPVEAAADVAATGSCHHHDKGAMSGMPSPVNMAKNTGKSSQHVTDCCKSGQCGCACLQATPTETVALSLHTAVLNQVASDSPIKPGHPSPALPNLIRPPIG